jgi:acetyl esterase/lipase
MRHLMSCMRLLAAIWLSAAIVAAGEAPKRPATPAAPAAPPPKGRAPATPAAPTPAPAPPQPEPDGVVRNAEYGRAGNHPLHLDLYLPSGGAKPYPVVVWIHGGGWSSGSRRHCHSQFLTDAGYAVASIDYRLSQSAKFPAQIEDCKTAVRWLRASAKAYGLNPDRIGAWGASAGGHLAALLGTSGGIKDLEGTGGNPNVSSRVQAVCDWFGPTDFLKMDAQSPPDSRILHDGPASPESRLIGGPLQQNKEKVAKANPITYVTADDPPFLIMHGDKDPLVPVHQSRILYDALRRAGVPATLQIVEGAGHDLDGETHHRAVVEFFDQHLKRVR